VALSSDGRRILSGSDDNTVRLCDAETGRELKLFAGHGAEVNGVAFLPDDCRVVSASHDRTLRLWDVETGRELRRLWHDSPVQCLAVSPDGRIAATGCHDNSVWIWTLPEQR